MPGLGLHFRAVMTNVRLLNRALALLAVLALALVATGCGQEDERVEGREGQYVDLNGLKYQVQLSRDLNPKDAGDRAYVGKMPPTKFGESYFGVFIRVINADGPTRTPIEAGDMKIIDTQGNEYHPIEADADGFAYQPIPLGDGDQIPEMNTPAFEGSIVGSLVLFKIRVESTENRPLELELEDPRSDHSGVIELDI